MTRLASFLTVLALVISGAVLAAAPAGAASLIKTSTSCSKFSGKVIKKGRIPIRGGGLSKSTYAIKAKNYKYCLSVSNATPKKGYIVLAFQYKNQCNKGKWSSASKNFGYRKTAGITFSADFEQNRAVAQVVYPKTKKTAIKSTTVSHGIIGCTG